MNPQFPHYWICTACAKERGGVWPERHVATLAAKMCLYCNGGKQLPTERFIAPYVDYNWPNLDTSMLRD